MLNTIKSKSISLLKFFVILPLTVGIILIANTSELKAQKEIRNEQVRSNKKHYDLTKIKKGVLVILDGEIYKKPIDKALIEKIDYVEYLSPKEGRTAYGRKGAKGVFVLLTKEDNISRPKLKKGYRRVKTVTKMTSGQNVKTNSYRLDDDALIIIDGKEYNKPMSTISTSTIESISVLKGKSATDVYGEKGKNGVVLITTKKKEK